MPDRPNDETVAMIIVICELLGKQTNANTVMQKFEAAMKEMRETRRVEAQLRRGPYGE